MDETEMLNRFNPLFLGALAVIKIRTHPRHLRLKNLHGILH